jgi:hypothetical protein
MKPGFSTSWIRTEPRIIPLSPKAITVPSGLGALPYRRRVLPKVAVFRYHGLP